MNNEMQLGGIQKDIESIRQDLIWLKERINEGMTELNRIKAVITETLKECENE